ncbi:MAG: hypothetical protein ACRCYX_10245, partial [Dermatophilaceae bacterium]
GEPTGAPQQRAGRFAAVLGALGSSLLAVGGATIINGRRHDLLTSLRPAGISRAKAARLTRPAFVLLAGSAVIAAALGRSAAYFSSVQDGGGFGAWWVLPPVGAVVTVIAMERLGARPG